MDDTCSTGIFFYLYFPASEIPVFIEGNLKKTDFFITRKEKKIVSGFVLR